ncbi:MAG: DUF6491 family protein [Pseudomonadales bacterium]
MNKGNAAKKLASLAVAGLLAVFAGSGLQAMPPELIGESVRSIPDANEISNWAHIDNQRVLVNLNAQDSYLITLKYQCHGLSWAQNVSVTMSNNTIWAGFDAIKADGLACPIDSIQKMSSKDLLEFQ